MDSPATVERSGSDSVRRKFSWTGMSVIWKGMVAVVAFAGAALGVWRQLPHPPAPHATISRVSFGDRLTHAQYLANAEFSNVADEAHDTASPYPPGALGSVYYYTVDIVGNGFYHIRYQLWDKNHNLKTKDPVEVRALLVKGQNSGPQAFWVPALSNVATVHLYVAPNNPPPLIYDWKDEAWN